MATDPVQNTTASPPSQDAAQSVPQRIPRSVLVLAGVLTLGVVMSTLDTSIVSVGVEAMGHDLDTPVSVIQWVATGYLLAFSMVIPLTGWAVDRFGIRRAWLTALAVFTAASLLCGLAWSAGSLIIFRVVQGLGGGMLLPLSQTALARAAGPRLIGRVMGVAAIPGMLAPVFGPAIGGLLVDRLSWPWLFWVNLPIGVVGLVLAARVLPRGEEVRAVPLDGLSVVLLSPGLALLVLGFTEAGGERGFGSPLAVPSLVLGAVMLAVFAGHSLRRGERALVDLRLFRLRSFAASAVASLLLGAALFGALILFPLYHQLVRGQDAVTAGALLAPQGLGAALVAPYAGKLTDRLGPGRVVPAGLVLALLGTLPYALADGDTPELLLAAALLVRGVGLGATFMPTLVAAYQGLGKESVPHATSVVNIAQRVGGSMGTAVLTVVLQRSYSRHAGDGSVLRAARTPAQLVPAFGDVFWWTLGFSLIALLPALLLPRTTRSEGR
ncbi:DHA2 family efflux MFS transporter permease subunit [Streptomyces thermodiastaticus]|uniref:DHA2 family efflux MFS transporter permease subunit n=1 Tax=Streptomyces thermodiastaticus TaxID=44061 RepID=UPI0016786120|nr:DHA2 family efflux MFS transporter permease subunit [Streptomyces thermodiastaticus]MCE7549814.1 DHA2 family efflux MFS transporter permease subunit [Streptomyces thermodiastaticus]GHF65916.1 MFS transporter [Streptomyces thermodiastaticus]